MGLPPGMTLPPGMAFPQGFAFPQGMSIPPFNGSLPMSPVSPMSGLGILPTISPDTTDPQSSISPPQPSTSTDANSLPLPQPPPADESPVLPHLVSPDAGSTATFPQPAPTAAPAPEPEAKAKDDDFYFDDGMMSDADFHIPDGEEGFDEELFDEMERPAPVAMSSPPPPPAPAPVPPTTAAPDPAPGSAVKQPDHAMAAYYSALAQAANQAAAEGRFSRHDSFSLHSPRTGDSAHDPDPPSAPYSSSRPSLIPDDSRVSQAPSLSPPPVPEPSHLSSTSGTLSTPAKGGFYGYGDPYGDDEFGFDYSDYDSALEDDGVIAAANAEALAQDEEGVYGREFGFYARAPASGEASPADETGLGGYFGPKTWGEYAE
ncbi:hypothetical protein EJ06DRAFT_556177 [Trichodelitschia bisporula]|uniref:Uncharacterized protein n=1 Tax=Trichodelitschia bisporula TaxID=703511 RepID=A0A6G1HXU5_9PEZI|nr:hypothetical protein EJ06DRAFT_556177 [Trichodelitschia bisporula]